MNQPRAFGQSGDLDYPGSPKPVLFYVDAEGKIHRVKWTRRNGNGVHGIGSNGKLTSDALEADCVMLEKLYAQDPRAEVREKGFDLYKAHDKAGTENRLPKERYKLRTMADGTVHWRTRPKPFPKEWLPQEVVARREGRSKLSKTVFEMPSAPADPEASDGEKITPYGLEPAKPKGKGKGGNAKNV